MQRQIMKPAKGMVVDHINHNRYDNTRANLRNVTPRENMCNMRKHARTGSNYKGVARDKRSSKWHAKIACLRVPVTVYGFREEAEAARAYDRVAVRLFGEVAELNFPEEWPPELRARVYAEAEAKREALRAKAARAKRRRSRKEKKKKGPRAASSASAPLARVPPGEPAIDRGRTPARRRHVGWRRERSRRG